MKITEVDKNFAVSESSGEKVFLDCRTDPMELTGLADRANGSFSRLPQEIEDVVRAELKWLARQTSGARLRFRTDSREITLRAKLPSVMLMRHMPLTGSSGFDVYAGRKLAGICAPVDLNSTTFEQSVKLDSAPDKGGMRDVTVNFPLYNFVDSLEVGFDHDSTLEPPHATRYGRVVFYGSSITQGGVASRPGTNYANLLAKNLDFELYNLGFSGNAFGDEPIADYIASLPMKVFVMDYDFNARSLEELEATHLPMYLKLREKQPEAGVIFITNPVAGVYLSLESAARRNAIVLKTYEYAVSHGDERVRYIDGASLFGEDERDTCTTDRLHPNDLGFFRMARRVEPVLSELLAY